MKDGNFEHEWFPASYVRFPEAGWLSESVEVPGGVALVAVGAAIESTWWFAGRWMIILTIAGHIGMHAQSGKLFPYVLSVFCQV